MGVDRFSFLLTPAPPIGAVSPVLFSLHRCHVVAYLDLAAPSETSTERTAKNETQIDKTINNVLA